MFIHEYQAKKILADYGIAMPRGAVARTPDEAEAIARDLRGSACMVKAQILAGGRGKAGGVRLAHTIADVRAAAAALLGARLVTEQTGRDGRIVKAVYVEEQIRGARELYLAALVDRSAGQVTLLASAAGGTEIEDTAARAPETLHRVLVDAEAGLDAGAARNLAAALGLSGGAVAAAATLMRALAEAFVALDASLIEINPLAVTDAGDVLVVDAKMAFDDNALFRHPEIAALRDADEVDPSEAEAARYEINYVRLDGDIGCMVNGAGLALASLDAVTAAGGAPADFMDVRPVASRTQVATGFKMILRNPKVTAILVNIFGGGILRCDTIAEGIAEAVRELGLRVPLIVRAAGTNREIAEKALRAQAIPVTFAADLDQAAALVVAAARR